MGKINNKHQSFSNKTKYMRFKADGLLDVS